MKKVRLVQIAIFFLIIMYSGAVQAVQHAFLIQNSGWMEPFYIDGHSEFKPLINAMIEAVADTGKPFIILAFNQTTPENESPRVVYQGTVGNESRNAVTNIALAHKGFGQALADTDFNEAVSKTIKGSFKGRPGILWIFTNNKNSPNNSPETAARNREFYNLVHTEAAITRSLAFSFAMPVKGNVFSANGMMVYALAYGAEADAHLQSIIMGSRLKRVVTSQPAQLKPLDKDAVKLVPKSVENAPNTSASLGPDGRTIILDIDVSSHHAVVKVISKLENLFFPYRIVSADLSARIEGKGWSSELSVAPVKIQDLGPGSVSDCEVYIPIRSEFPDIWSLKSLLDFGRQVLVPSVIQIRLDNQNLKIDDAFKVRLGELFPGDPLPEVFVPPVAIQSSVATIPLLIRVNYPLWPLMIFMGIILALLAGVIVLFSLSRSVGSFEILVDGTTRRISMKRFSRMTISNNTGKNVGVIKRGIVNPQVESLAEGHTMSILNR